MLKELLVGLAFAYALGALFAAVQAAGALLDTLIGFSFGAPVDPVNGNQSTVLSQHLRAVRRGDLHRHRRRRLGHPGPRPHLRRRRRSTGRRTLGSLVAGAQTAFSAIFVSAHRDRRARCSLALILTDAAFGVVSRVVPQLNIFAVGFPAKVDGRPDC